MKFFFKLLGILIFYSCALNQPKTDLEKNERFYNKIFCSLVQGKTEKKHYYNYQEKQGYSYQKKQGYILVDCETKQTVFEGGLDKRSSLDSLQQAVFAASLTGKKPAIVLYDTDEQFEKYEHRIAVASKKVGILFLVCPAKKLAQNTSMTKSNLIKSGCYLPNK